MTSIKDIENEIILNALRIYAAMLKQSVQCAKNHGVFPFGVEAHGTETLKALIKRFEESEDENS